MTKEIDMTERELNIERVREFVNQPGWSQRKLAEKAGISSGTVSAVLGGEYSGDFEGNMKKLLVVIHNEEEKLTSNLKKPSFISTSAYRRISYMLGIAQTDTNITVLTGNAGIGKTTALQVYHEKNPATILIEFDNTYSLATVLQDISEALNLNITGRKDKIFKAVVEKLKGSDRMIIIDEADALKRTRTIEVLNTLRRIHDLADVPVVLVGLPRLLHIINETSASYQQIYSRMIAASIDDITEEDAKGLITSALGKIDDELVSEFYKHSRGSARRLTRLLIWAQRTARQHDVSIGKKVIKTAAGLLL